MENNDELYAFKAAELLTTTISYWKLQPQLRNESRNCKLIPVAHEAGELKLELFIHELLCTNSFSYELIVIALPFYTSTLGLTSKNKEYKEECTRLKLHMENLDQEFNKASGKKTIVLGR